MSAIRLGLASVLPNKTGSIAMPEEIIFSCPRCGELAADRGQCLVEIYPVRVPDTISRTGFLARLQIDCRACGCSEGEPAIVKK